MTDKERLENIDENKELNVCGITGKPLSVELSIKDYSYLHTQAKRVQELKSENNALKTVAMSNKFIGEHYKQQKERYREALEFYADEDNYFFDEKEYKVGLGVPESEITIDYGNKARKALEGE